MILNKYILARLRFTEWKLFKNDKELKCNSEDLILGTGEKRKQSKSCKRFRGNKKAHVLQYPTLKFSGN